MTPGHEALEDPQPLCSNATNTDVVSWSPLKRLTLEDPSYSTFDTASLTCSESLNSSVTDDTDDDSYSVSPDYSRNRYRRISSHFSLPQNLHVIKDLSFDDYATMEEKIHKPSQIRKWENRRRRLVLALPLVFAILLAHFLLNHPHRIQPSDRHTQWKRFSKVDAPRVRRMIQMSAIPDKFTIRLSGSRSDLLERSVDVLTRCSSVEEVQVEWKSSMGPPRKLFRHASGKVARVEQLVTNAVLLLDEDVFFTCDELERGKKTVCYCNPDYTMLIETNIFFLREPFPQASNCGGSIPTAWLAFFPIITRLLSDILVMILVWTRRQPWIIMRQTQSYLEVDITN